MNARDIQEKTLGVSHLPINTPTNSPTSLRSGRLPPQAGFLTALVLGIVLASVVNADVLVLRNGQRINGTLSNRELVQSDPSGFSEITFLIDTPDKPILQIFNVEEIEYVQVQVGTETTIIDFRQATGIVPTVTEPGDSSQTVWSTGVKAGINLGRLRGDDATGFDEFRTGAIAGAFVTAQTKQSFAVRVEMLYTQKGGKGSASTVDGPIEIEFQLNYIEVPVLFVGILEAGGNTRVNFLRDPRSAFSPVPSSQPVAWNRLAFRMAKRT